jgi:serine kinase of HPr protein (carbohydrate metabolism regulator)
MRLDIKKISFQKMIELLDLQIIYASNSLEQTFFLEVIASDLMSDVLMATKELDLLVTSLSTDQVIRTANIMDMAGIVIVNNKEITPTMIELAKDFNICLFSSKMTKYEVCCLIYDLQKE